MRMSFTNVNKKKIRMFFFDEQLFTVNQFLVEMFEHIFSFLQLVLSTKKLTEVELHTELTL